MLVVIADLNSLNVCSRCYRALNRILSNQNDKGGRYYCKNRLGVTIYHLSLPAPSFGPMLRDDSASETP
jgi:hypothetical protein